MYQLSQLAFSLWRLDTCQKSHQMGIFSQQQDKDAMKEKCLVEVREGIVFWQKLTLWSLKSTWLILFPCLQNRNDLSLYLVGIFLYYCCCHKLPQIPGLEQYKFTIIQFWRSELQSQFHWPKSRWWKACVPSGRCRKAPSSLVCPAIGCLHSLGFGPFLHLQVSSIAPSDLSLWFGVLFPPLHPPLWFWPPPIPSPKAPWDYIRSTWIIQDNLPTLRSLTHLNHIYKFLSIM